MPLVSFYTLLVLVDVARSQTVPAPVAVNPPSFAPAASPSLVSPGAIPSILSPATASLPSFFGPASTPSILSPEALPSLITPSQPTDLSPECIDQFGAFAICYFANLGCVDTCASDTNTPSEITGCDNIDTVCEQVSCCPPCIATAKAYVACESNARGCETNCADVAPVAPSPVPPTSPSTQDLCRGVSLVWYACLLNNADSCDESNCTAVETPSSTICDDIITICTPLTCCDACSNEGKALGACYADLFQCESDCGSYSPVAPSVIDITLPPALNFFPSMMIPTVTTTAAPAATTAAPSTPPVGTTTSAPAAPSNDATTDAPVSDAPVVPTTASNTTKAPAAVNGTKAPTSAAYQPFVTSMSIAVLVSIVFAIALQSYMV